jgi:PAS domain S-box-containing protein
VERTSELQRALADLRDSEQHLRTVVTNAPIILSSIDHTGNFTLAEGRGLASLGFSSVQAIGQSVFNIYDNRPDILEDVRQGLAGERITTIREIGGYVFETWYTPLMDANGAMRGTICVSVDITARQQAEQELRERGEELARVNRELARAARLKDEFLANMSHELRTPLTSILGRSELLQEDSSGLLTEFQRRSVRSIEESGHHLLELINDILDLSKIEAGKITLEPAAVVVAELCQSCVRMIHATAFKQRLTVHISIDPAVVTIIADERRLKQILVNLLSNAIKFTPVDRNIGLEVYGDAVAQEAHFTVWDTGIGIAKADQERLFQPFVQIDSSLTRQYEGTGLGLVLVAHLAAMHGGRVTLESAPDQGSRFTITLPWIQHAMPMPSSITSGLQKSMTVEADTSKARPTLLLVEDNLETQQLIAEYLELKGCAVTCTNNGYEAIEHVQAKPPDVIVMDVQMPKLDGLATIQLLRTNPAYVNLPILVLSARAMPGDREQILAAGANAYLSKPVQLAELNHTVATLLASVQKGSL